MKSPMIKLAAAAIIIAVPIVLSQFDSSLENVAWSDVAERFASVPFFSVTIYLGYETSAEAKKIEIWKSEDSLIRAHEGGKVLFASAVDDPSAIFDFGNASGQVVAFDRSTKQAVEADGMARLFLRLLCPKGRFSLNTLLASAGDEMEITTVAADDATTSAETIVYDGNHKSTPERVRIWALRRSRLPVRLRFEDPRNGECADLLFNYTDKKDAAFFSPEVFKQQTTAN
ncbi:MAG: hypothetical protein JSW27_01740 [Phycisphaerales bacterium]|nr:MAG: hypothetical protein JSW27_01740 [Phycisphaerales bacterium]